jgi:hypothetical protein
MFHYPFHNHTTGFEIIIEFRNGGRPVNPPPDRSRSDHALSTVFGMPGKAVSGNLFKIQYLTQCPWPGCVGSRPNEKDPELTIPLTFPSAGGILLMTVRLLAFGACS